MARETTTVDPHVGPLPVSGAWADVRTEITYGTRRGVQIALAHRRDSDATISTLWEAELLVAMVAAWSCRDAAGEVLPITIEGVDKLDARDCDVLVERAAAAYRAGVAPLDPKAGLPSSASAPESP